jgi:DNA polymerase-3 subunit gamma/tau
MDLPLYLKYRPKKLSELVGQDVLARTLSNAISFNKLAHAYLFTGPRGCGKTSTARILAKSLNCIHGPTVDPCGECNNCVEIAQGISPDVIEIDAASNKKVEDARQVIERCHLAPQTAKNKIYIFDEVHMLTRDAFNALLKTIEEPPPNVIFILATTEENKVPPTIISRCQRFLFKSIDEKPLLEHLLKIAEIERINLLPSSMNKIIRHSKGGLRDALSLLQQVSVLTRDGQLIDEGEVDDLLGSISDDLLRSLINSIVDKEPDSAYVLVKQILDDGVDPVLFLRNLLEFCVSEIESLLKEKQNANPIIMVAEQLFKAEMSIRYSSNQVNRLKTVILSIASGLFETMADNNQSANNQDNSEIEKRLTKLEKTVTTLSKPESRNIKSVQDVKPEEHFIKPEVEVLRKEVVEEKLPVRAETSPTQTSDSSVFSINKLLTLIKSAPLKAAMQGGSVFVESIEEGAVYLAIPPSRKTFFDKLNEPKKLAVIQEAASEIIGRACKVFLKVSSSEPLPQPKIELENISVTKPFAAESSIQPFSVEAPQNFNEDEIIKTAKHILGAREIEERK